MSWITGAEWGYKIRSAITPMPLPAKNLYFHHTVTPVTSDSKADTRTVQSSVWTKYSAIPYNGLVHPNGDILHGRYLNGKPALGAHTAGHNSDGLGLAAIGNYETIEPSKQLIGGLIEAGRLWVAEGLLVPNFGGGPHKNYYQTACCGKYLVAKLDYIIKEIKAGSAPAPIQPRGVPVAAFQTFNSNITLDNEGRGYVDVYHQQGVDPLIAVAQGNGTDNKKGYPNVGTPVFLTAGFNGTFVRVTVVGGKPKSGFGIKVLMGW